MGSLATRLLRTPSWPYHPRSRWNQLIWQTHVMLLHGRETCGELLRPIQWIWSGVSSKVDSLESVQIHATDIALIAVDFRLPAREVYELLIAKFLRKLGIFPCARARVFLIEIGTTYQYHLFFDPLLTV